MKRFLSSQQRNSSSFWSSLKSEKIKCKGVPTGFLLLNANEMIYAVSNLVVFNSKSNFVASKFRKHGSDTITFLGRKDANSQILFAGTSVGNIYLINISDLSLLRSFKAHDSAIRGIFYKSDSREIITLSDDSYIKKWDFTSSSAVSAARVHKVFYYFY